MKEEIVAIPIEDTLDLHTFLPKEIPDLLEDYFSECIKSGIFSVRVIHGKGKGILKKRVYSLLKKNEMVISFHEAPGEAGGWGAVLIELKQNRKQAYSTEAGGENESIHRQRR